MKRAVLALIFLLLPIHVWATAFYVGCVGGSIVNTPDDGGACTSMAAPCETLAGARTKLAAAVGTGGHSLTLEDGCDFTVTTAWTTPNAGTAANHNIIQRSNTGSTMPVWRSGIILSGWTVCTGSNCGSFVNSQVYKYTPSTFIHEWGLTIDGERHDDVNGQWDRMSLDALNDGVANCPNTTLLSFDKAWCSSILPYQGLTGPPVIYMRSNSGDPDTRWPNRIRGILTSTAINLLQVDDPYWDVSGIRFEMSGSHVLQVKNTHDVTITGVELANSVRGGRNFAVWADAGQESYNVILQDSKNWNCGRDCGDYSAQGNVHDIIVRRNEIYNSFDHATWNMTLVQSNIAGPRDNLTFEDNYVHDVCNGFEASHTPSDNIAPRVFITRNLFTDFANQSTLTNNPGVDPRVPPVIGLNSNNFTPTTVAECNAGVGPTGIRALRKINITAAYNLVRGARWGAFYDNTTAILTLNDNTFVNNWGGGVAVTKNGGAITLNRNIIAFNGAGGTLSGGNFQIGCTGNCANTQFLGGNTSATQNMYWHANAVSGRFARTGENTTGYDQTAWRARVNNDENSATHQNPLFVNVASDQNLQSGSPAKSAAGALTPFTGAGRELGGREAPEFSTVCATIDSNTFRCPVNSTRTPITVVGSSLSMVGKTLTNATVEASGASFLVDAAPSFLPGETPTLVVAYCGVESGPIVGNIEGNCMLATSVSVTNNNILPSPIDCAVADNDRDAITVRFNSNNSSPMLPVNNCTGFDVDDNASMTSPTTPDDCDRIGTTDSFLIDMASNFTAGQAVYLRYQTTGNVSNQAAVEPAAFVMQCTNGIIPAATTMYVDPGCSNGITTYVPSTRACTGGSDLSYSTIANAMAGGVFSSGNTLLIRDGTYAENFENAVPSGTSWSNPTTVKAYPGETVTIQPDGALFAVHVNAKIDAYQSYEDLILDGTNSTVSTARIEGCSTHVRFIGGKMQNAANGNGLSMGKCGNGSSITSLEVTNVEIANNAFDGINVQSSGNTMDQLYIHDNGQEGVAMGQTTGSIDSNTVSRSKLVSNGTHGIAMQVGAGNRAVNNRICGNMGSGINITSAQTSALIENNSITENDAAGITNTGIDTIIRNTIAYNNTTGGINDTGSGTTLTTNLTTDPGFVDASTCDLRLTANTSAAYNTGTTLAGVTIDYAGVARPAFGSYDIGSDEFNSPDTSPPLVFNCTPMGTLPAGTTTTTLRCETSEAATCKHGTIAGTAYASIANTFTSTGGLVHTATIGSLTDGGSYNRYVRCLDGSGNANTTDTTVSWTVAYPDPTVAACAVTNGMNDKVVCTLNLFGSSPVLPANNCTGWTCQKDTGSGYATWTVDDCDRQDATSIVLDLANDLANGNSAQCTFTRGTGSTVTNNAGQELVAGTFMVSNGVAPPTPDPVGNLAVSERQCHRSETDGQTFTNTNTASAVNGECRVMIGGRVRGRMGVDCPPGDPCEDHVLVPYGCDGTCGTEANWYAVGNNFNGHLLSYAADSRVTNLAASTQQLTSCGTFIAGALRTQSQTSFPVVTFVADSCTELEESFAMSPSAVADNTVVVCLRLSDGTALNNCSPSDYAAGLTLRAVAPSAGR